MSKKDRLSRIVAIISEKEIETQEELTAELIAEGFDVSQATVSRDINELGLIKTAGFSKKFRYSKLDLNQEKVSEKYIDLFKQVVLSINFANNLIVIKTLSGNAGTAGMAIDAMRFSQILGSVAGDDTLLIVAKSNSDAEIIVKGLKAL